MSGINVQGMQNTTGSCLQNSRSGLRVL
jgi:hypothetical protein